MALHETTEFSFFLGFPRPRGDGPPPGRRAGPDGPVPPPTRGWPAFGGTPLGAGSGSPAHAGMAPRPAYLPQRRAGFPRPRGDGPGSEPWTGSMARVPPPTRGWPISSRVSIFTPLGSPAHAGMAPSTFSPTSPTSWFPRPRGDGPMADRVKAVIEWVPPPTRGWPRPARCRARSRGGSPAHAGMARRPRPPGRAGVGHRFPRPRGDGPTISPMAVLPTVVPPPTRGWPPSVSLGRGCSPGSPAHAGMARPSPGCTRS